MTKHEQNPSNPAINAKKTLCYLSKANRIVQKLEVATIKVLKMTCANGEFWMCHMVIAGFTTHYKEQVVTTGIKSGMQCLTYIIPANKRENMCKN